MARSIPRSEQGLSLDALQEQLRSGELYGSKDEPKAEKRAEKARMWANLRHLQKEFGSVLSMELACERCGASPAAETPRMTAYLWDGKGKDPNVPLTLCVFCADEHTEDMKDQWNAYYSDRL